MIIYAVKVNESYVYVGSSKRIRYKKRKASHSKRFGPNCSFEVLEVCEDDERLERESHHYKRLKLLGFELVNKFDPIDSPNNEKSSRTRRANEKKRRDEWIELLQSTKNSIQIDEW